MYHLPLCFGLEYRMFRLHCVRWDNMLNTVWVLSCDRLEAASWTRPAPRPSPSVSTARISSVTWRKVCYYCNFLSLTSCTCMSDYVALLPVALQVCSPAACRAEYEAAGRLSPCSRVWWWNYSRWTPCWPAHVSPRKQNQFLKAFMQRTSWFSHREKLCAKQDGRKEFGTFLASCEI